MKYIASIQPWSDYDKMLKATDLLAKNGVYLLRINTKPCSERVHYKTLKHFIKQIIQTNSKFKFLIDIGYPNDSYRTKIHSKPYYIDVKENEILSLYKINSKKINNNSLYLRNIYDFNLFNINDTLIYGDGEIKFTILSKNDNRINLLVNNSGRIWDGKSLHFKKLELCNNTNFDLVKNFLLELPTENLEGIICSFVETDEQIKNIRNTTNIKIVSKIETHRGIKNINKIASNSDAIMLGRGDLYCDDYSPATFLKSQQKFLNYIVSNNVVSIISTDLLSSMKKNSIPNRSELTDIKYLLKYKPDYLCLSSDILYGDFFTECISIINKIEKSNNKTL